MEATGTIVELLRPQGNVILRETDGATSAPGAYVLILELADSVPCMMGRREVEIPAGCYVYSGSAYGPGGIRARLARHFRKDKTIHWHVDRLTLAAASIGALAFEGGSECDLVACLAASGAFAPTIAGFGSSDCPACEAHLLRWLGPVA